MKYDPSEYEQDPNAPPVHPMPFIVVALAALLFGVELVLQAGNAGLIGGPQAAGWRLAMMEDWGFYEPVFNWMVEHRTWRWDYLVRFVSYPFVHGSFTHMLFAVVFILALGKMVGELFRWWAVLVIFFGATVLGALAYGLVWDTRVMLVGAYPAAYGFIGAYSYILWTALSARGENRMRAFTLIGFLMGLQLLWGLLGSGAKDWVADLAGFAAGFLLSIVVHPGGWGQLMARLRQR